MRLLLLVICLLSSGAHAELLNWDEMEAEVKRCVINNDYKEANMDESIMLAVGILRREEGFEETPYVDTEGYVTVGYGLKISGRDQSIRDFDDFPVMPEEVAACWMQSLVKQNYRHMERIPQVDSALRVCNPERQAILLSMAYQLGITGLRKFRNTLLHIQEENFEGAAIEMLDSRWARQTTYRAERHAEVMKGGQIIEYYREAN